MRGFLLEEKTSISDSGIPIDPDPELPGMTGSEIGRDEVAWEEQVSVFEVGIWNPGVWGSNHPVTLTRSPL